MMPGFMLNCWSLRLHLGLRCRHPAVGAVHGQGGVCGRSRGPAGARDHAAVTEAAVPARLPVRCVLWAGPRQPLRQGLGVAPRGLGYGPEPAREHAPRAGEGNSFLTKLLMALVGLPLSEKV